MQRPSLMRGSFHDAIILGDLETIAAYVAQPHVLREIHETNAYIIESGVARYDAVKQRDGSQPWFKDTLGEKGRFPGYSSRWNPVSLVKAAYNGHAHVFEWLFARDRAELMPETLVLLIDTAFTSDNCTLELTRAHEYVLEAVLTSHVFLRILLDETRQRILDDIAGSKLTDELLRLVIAHGARVDEPSVLERVILSGNFATFDAMAEEGACLVGANVMSLAASLGQFWTATFLVEHGADWGDHTSKPLIIAAENLDEHSYGFGMLLDSGFYDLEMRDEDGKTALMLAASYDTPPPEGHGYYAADDPGVEFAVALLREGADIHAVDHDGRTALDYARSAHNYYSPYDICNILEVAMTDQTSGINIEHYRNHRRYRY